MLRFRPSVWPRDRSVVRQLVVCFSIVSGLAAELPALDLYWDINGALSGASNGSAADGSWSLPNWSSNSGGGSTTGPWIADSTAVFSAGGNATGSFAVTFSSPQSVSNIRFEEGSVGIVGLSQLTLTGGEVSVASGLTASISVPIGGTAGLEKTGDGTLTVNGEAFGYSGDTIVSGGILKLVGGTINNYGVMHAADGTILELGVTSTAGVLIGGHLATTGSGVVNVSNIYKLQDVTIDAGTLLHFTGGSDLTLQGNITNNVTIEKSVSVGNIKPIGTVTFAGTGTLKLSDSGFNKVIGTGSGMDVVINEVQHTIAGAGIFSWGGRLNLINHGLIDANQPSTLAIDLSLGGAGGTGDTVINTGTMQASNGGTLYMASGPITNTGGVIRALTGSVVSLAGGLIVINGTLSTIGSGRIQVVDSSSSGPATLQDVTLDTGTVLQIASGNELNLKGTITNNGSFGLGIAAGNTRVAIDGSVTVSGTGVWQMTPISNNAITAVNNGAVLTNDVSHTIQGRGIIGQFGGLSLVNKGLIDANNSLGMTVQAFGGATATNFGTMRSSNGSTLTFQYGPLTNSGILEALNGSAITMDLYNASLTNVTAGTLSGGSYRSVNNGGGASMSITSSSVTTIGAGTTVELSGAGAIMKFGDTDLAASIVNNAGTLKILNGHQFTLGLGHALNNSGTLLGNGTIVGNISNSGLVLPGASPGTLHINGSYTQTSAGELHIELASAFSYDSLDVTGSVNLAGTLSVELVGGFTPVGGESFNILDFASLTPSSPTLSLPTLGGSLSWNISQLFTTGVISISGGGLAGDYNHDGHINAADYVVWRKNAGMPSEYGVWRSNFGNPPGSGSGNAHDLSSAGVPEPTSFVLVLAMVVTAIVLPRHNRVLRLQQ